MLTQDEYYIFLLPSKETLKNFKQLAIQEFAVMKEEIVKSKSNAEDETIRQIQVSQETQHLIDLRKIHIWFFLYILNDEET